MPPDTPPADSPRDESTLRHGAPTIRDQPATVDIPVPGSTHTALPVDQHVFTTRYIQRGVIGQGGMGEVRLTHDVGIGMLAVVVPLLLELFGVVPPSFQFEAGRLVLLPRMIDIPPAPTILLLLIGNIAMVVPEEARDRDAAA